MNLNLVSRKLVPLGLLTAFALICYVSQRGKAVTVDEFCHFPPGIYNLATLDWRMNRETPPLIKCLPSLTALITKPHIETKAMEVDPNAWSFGYSFMSRNFGEYQQIFSYGRCIVILLGCIGGWILYRFGTEIYGYRGGLFSLFLYVLNPNIIAHSRLTTIDAGATCMFLLSLLLLLEIPQAYGWDFRSIIAGIALGYGTVEQIYSIIIIPNFYNFLQHIVVISFFFLHIC